MQGWITNKSPDQLQLPFGLWTAQAVRELIHKKFGKTLGLSTMQLYLKRWGFTSQKPLTRATQRDPQKIAAWLRSDYPSIAARAKREKAAKVTTATTRLSLGNRSNVKGAGAGVFETKIDFGPGAVSILGRTGKES